MGSDHGQETVRRSVPVVEALVAAGLKEAPDSPEMLVAPQGTAGLVYLYGPGRRRLAALQDFFGQQDWVGHIAMDGELSRLGLPREHGLTLAFSMAKSDESNRYGVPGLTDMVAALNEKDYTGRGQHGGLGRYERNPFLLAVGPGFAPGSVQREGSCIVDIAPTVLAHLGLEAGGVDGVARQG